MVFQEDNDGGHGSGSEENVARYYKDRWNIDYIDNWPPQSPDLNPIENIWRILKQRVKSHRPRTSQELRKAIEVEWERISIDEINDYILGSKHMRSRMQECCERQGNCT